MYENYARLRDSRGLTDYRVCKETGIAPGSMSDWKHGRYKPNLGSLLKIADLFGVTLDELVGRGNENISNGSSEETGN